ncbi:MAG: HAD family hydrolase [Thermoguttaceae bacterium]
MSFACREIIRRHSRPLVPKPTGERPVLRRWERLDAVLFDVYGTLFISSSGEPGAGLPGGAGESVAAALAAAGAPFRGSADGAWEMFVGQVQREHEKARLGGRAHPEVDIVQIWGSVVAELAMRGWIEADAVVDPVVLAAEFEVRTNPVWPMPGLRAVLEGLLCAGKVLGLISNAQSYTVELFPALLGHSPEELGFGEDLQFYSYRYGFAKPGRELYLLAAAALRRRGIPVERSLYVGNDMRNDIVPAAAVGFRTALFAGDARSLRRRPDEANCAGIVPDLVVTDLRELLDCI